MARDPTPAWVLAAVGLVAGIFPPVLYTTARTFDSIVAQAGAASASPAVLTLYALTVLTAGLAVLGPAYGLRTDTQAVSRASVWSPDTRRWTLLGLLYPVSAVAIVLYLLERRQRVGLHPAGTGRLSRRDLARSSLPKIALAATVVTPVLAGLVLALSGGSGPTTLTASVVAALLVGVTGYLTFLIAFALDIELVRRAGIGWEPGRGYVLPVLVGALLLPLFPVAAAGVAIHYYVARGNRLNVR